MSSQLTKKYYNKVFKSFKMPPRQDALPNIPDDVLNKPVIQPIFLIQQFFISDNKERQKEINFCLKENVKNKLFTKIILINEKIYTKEELGIDDL